MSTPKYLNRFRSGLQTTFHGMDSYLKPESIETSPLTVL